MTVREAIAEMFGLTEKQGRVLAFIMEYRWDHGYSPTIREVADGLGFACPNAAHVHLVALGKKGAIRYREQFKLARSLVPKVRFIPASELGG